MKKPKITLERIMYEPLQGQPYPVYVVDGAHRAPYAQGYIHCAGCGVGKQYRYNSPSEWVRLKCPLCKTVFAWFDDLGEDEEGEDE